jgi:predicted RNA-binding Zn-ribbon protein involved in translation (DUF1610 family)
MEALDGNAIAGALFEHFGSEMTTVAGACVHCGTVAQIAELKVYVKAPGTVVRCPTCGKVVIVLVEVHGMSRIDASGLEL